MTTPAALDRTGSDGGQRSPGPLALLRSVGSVVVRLPGMAQATLTYLRHRPRIEHVLVVVPGAPPSGPDPDRQFPGDQQTVLRRSAGRGRLFHRTYAVTVQDARTGPKELLARLLADPNRASPTEVATFEPRGTGRGPGAEFAVHMPGPWDAPVRVVETGPDWFTLATLRGHMEAGEITFRAAWGDGGRLEFVIESWARSGDRLYDWLYDKVPLTREMQLHMWAHVCEQVARLTGGHQQGPVRVHTERFDG